MPTPNTQDSVPKTSQMMKRRLNGLEKAEMAALTYAVKTAKQKDPTISDTVLEEIY